MRLRPDTITGWFLLVLVLVLAALTVGMLALFARDRVQTLEAAGLRQTAARLAAAVETVAAAPPETRPAVVRALGGPGFHLVLAPRPLTEDDGGPLPRILRGLLQERLPEGTALRVGRGEPPGQPGPGWRHGPAMHRLMRAEAAGLAPLAASIRLPDGQWLTGLTLLEQPERLWQPPFLALLAGLTLVVAGIAYWGVRRAVRPLHTLEAAALRLAGDVHAAPLPETGPREVRRAAAAFNEMQRRLARYVEDRTRMLAAISHDLRTPITRLRLRAELMEDGPDRDKMLADLADMERMVTATLSFARQDAEAEPATAVDLAALLRAAAEDRPGVSVTAPGSLLLTARPTGLRRIFGNLLDNAARYGGDACHVTLSATTGEAVVTLDDRGPGIPAAEREKVFAPFYRLEASRSRETGGTGLGLSVARTIVHAHGGTIRLGDAPDGGGLRVEVRLPLG